MKADDRTMTLLTGIVLTIGVGTLAQNTDAIMSAFTGETNAAAADDSFTIRAGKPQTLDILANDPDADKAGEIQIVTRPNCGVITNVGQSLEYTESDTCSGITTFEYCFDLEGECESASVTLNVIGKPAPRKEVAVVAVATPAPAEPQPQLPQPHIAGTAPADPEPEAVDDIRLAVLSALDRPVDNEEEDDEETVASFRPPPTLPAANALAPPRATPAREPNPDATISRLEEALEVPVFDDEEQPTTASIPEVPDIEGSSPAESTLDELAMTSVIRGSIPDFGIESAAQIMLPTTQDRIGNRVGAASRTEDLAALRTDTRFIARMDADQLLPAPQVAHTAELTGAAQPQLPLTPVPETQTAALCSISIDLTVSTGATLLAAIDAACHPSEMIAIEHAGVRFSAITDPGGKVLVNIPAITADAKVSVQFADGLERVATVLVPDMDRYLRVAVTWDGTAELDLHALEFGADTGDRGHVWSGAPRSYRDSRRFGGGYLTSLGLGAGKGPQAEVYTLPLFRRADVGLVEMSLSLIGDAACNRDFSLRAVRSDARPAASIRELRFKVTDCDRRSEPVFIANALEDLRVASSR